MSPESHALSPGDRVGPYRLERRLGWDSVGERWLAIEERLERDVALRIVSRRVAGHPEAVGRFTRTCRGVAALDHPSLLPIYRVEEGTGTAYVASRWVGSADPSDHAISAAELSPAHAAHLIGQIANALDVAHANWIFHGAVGPASVKIDGDHAYLAEFGVGAASAALEESAEPSRGGDIKALGELLELLLQGSKRGKPMRSHRRIAKPLQEALRRSRPEDASAFISAGELGRAAVDVAGPYWPSERRTSGIVHGRRSLVTPIAVGAILLLGAGTWLVARPEPSLEESQVRSVVERFAGSSACELMTDTLVEASGGPKKCRRTFADRGSPNLSIDSVEITGDIASVSVSTRNGNHYQLRLAQENGAWAVDAVSGGPG